MKNDIFLDVTDKIEDDILEKGIRLRDEYRAKRQRRIMIRKWAFSAAAVVLVTTVVLFSVFTKTPIGSPDSANSASNPNSEQNRTDPFGDLQAITLTAQQLTDMFPVKDSTNSYQKIYAPSDECLNVVSPPQIENVPIFSYNNQGLALSRDELTAYRNAVQPKLTKAFRITAPMNSYDSYDGQWSSPSMSYTNYDRGDVFSSVAQSPATTLVRIWQDIKEASDGEYYVDPLLLNGKEISVDQTLSNQELLASLEWVKEELFKLFDVRFTDAVVIREYDDKVRDFNQPDSVSLEPEVVEYLYVYYYNKDDIFANGYDFGNNHFGEHIKLVFDNYQGQFDPKPSADILREVSITYEKYRQPLEKTVTAAGKARLLTLDEAEELLKKGYVFGHHICNLCMQSQDMVDFEEYDVVGFEYVWYRNYKNDTSLIVPFYTFYKVINTRDDGYKTYAKTYVPAIPIEGLEEYFKEQESLH